MTFGRTGMNIAHTGMGSLVAAALFVVCVSAHCMAQSGTKQPHDIADRFRSLTRNSEWKLEHEIRAEFDTHHPQGMVLLDNTYYVTSVETINRAREEGRAHLFVMDASGSLLRSAELSDGPMYHPGGMAYDGSHLWISVAEYRPDSQSIVYRVNPDTLDAEKIFTFDDHLGAILFEPGNARLTAVSWGSRRYYHWRMERSRDSWRPVDPSTPEMTPNGGHYVDFQDNQWLPGTSSGLFGGLSRYRQPEKNLSFALGAIELIDLEILKPLHQLPLSLWSPSGRPMTQNPFFVRGVESGLEFHFMPDDNDSIIYVYGVRAE